MAQTKHRFLKRVTGLHNRTYEAGEIVNYEPCFDKFQDMDEPARVKKGVFVFKLRNEYFKAFRLGVDVERVAELPERDIRFSHREKM